MSPAARSVRSVHIGDAGLGPLVLRLDHAHCTHTTARASAGSPQAACSTNDSHRHTSKTRQSGPAPQQAVSWCHAGAQRSAQESQPCKRARAPLPEDALKPCPVPSDRERGQGASHVDARAPRAGGCAHACRCNACRAKGEPGDGARTPGPVQRSQQRGQPGAGVRLCRSACWRMQARISHTQGPAMRKHARLCRRRRA